MAKSIPAKKTIKEPQKVRPKKKAVPKKVVQEKSARKPVKKTEAKDVDKTAAKKARTISYFEATGRRKTAVARVRLFTQGEKMILVNDKQYQQYFSAMELQSIILAPLELMNCLDKFRVQTIIRGGGLHAQAEALRHGIARALTLFNPTFKKRLKKAGYLTRDSRMRERKKFGLKRARRAPQWSKR